MKVVNAQTITNIRKVLLPRFHNHVAQDIDAKLSGINPSDTVSERTAKDNRISVSNYWYRMFGTVIYSSRGQEQLARLANQTG